MRAAYATFVRNWTVMLRAYPWSFFVGNLLTGALLVGIGYLAYNVLADRKLSADFASLSGTGDYISFLILGAVGYLVVVRMMLWVSRSLISERREGTLESLLLAPASRFAYFVGIASQATVAVAFEAAVLLLLAWPLGLNLGSADVLSLVVALPIALVGVFGLSIVLGAVMLATGDTYISQNTLFDVLALVGGFTFPAAYLPDPLLWLGRAVPVTWSLEALRGALLEHASVATVAPALAVAGLMGVAYLVAGLLLFPGAEARALEAASG